MRNGIRFIEKCVEKLQKSGIFRQNSKIFQQNYEKILIYKNFVVSLRKNLTNF